MLMVTQLTFKNVREKMYEFIKYSNFAHPKQACNNAQQGNVTP